MRKKTTAVVIGLVLLSFILGHALAQETKWIRVDMKVFEEGGIAEIPSEWSLVTVLVLHENTSNETREMWFDTPEGVIVITAATFGPTVARAWEVFSFVDRLPKVSR